MRGLMPTGTVARTVPKPTASTGLLGSQLGLMGSAVAEQSGMLMMLTEPAWTPSPALATTISLRAGAKSAQSGEVPTAIGLVAPDGHDVEQVGLSVDDADGAVGLVHDEGALGVGGHDAVDGAVTDGDWSGIDGVAGGLDGGDLARAAAGARADGVDAWGAGDADHVDRREGRVDGEFLLQVEGLTDELGDGVEAGIVT